MKKNNIPQANGGSEVSSEVRRRRVPREAEGCLSRRSWPKREGNNKELYFYCRKNKNKKIPQANGGSVVCSEAKQRRVPRQAGRCPPRRGYIYIYINMYIYICIYSYIHIDIDTYIYRYI